MLHQKRIERLREMMKEKYIFGVYVTSPENVFYLSGFTGFGDARLLIGRTNAWLITDSRYTVQAAEECPEYTLVTANAENIATLEELLRKEMICTLGFENERIAYRDYKALKERYDFVQLAELDGYFTELRDVKEEDELFCIEKACQIACRSLYEVLDDIRPGTAESEIAAELEYRMRKNGASGKSFETIVASGKRSAMPHGVASDKKIENGDAVTIDFGCIYKHYCSDMTRTFFVGRPDAELESIYRIVYEAQIAAMEGYRFGMTGAELDAISREIITEKGYGPNFGHSLGHGVGIEIHEGAAISRRNTKAIQKDTVFSIEPGIYVEGLGGVRIEDLVVAGENGLRILTSDFDKKMLVL